MPWRGPVAEKAETGFEFPTLGIEAWQWIEAHCVIPDGPFMGQPYMLTNEMIRFLVHYYRVAPDSWSDKFGGPKLHHERGGQLVRPQKWGKGPFLSAIICFEAEGPAVPAGWDAAGRVVGRPWNTPLIPVTAVSELQTANVFKALLPMIWHGPLANVIPDAGETRINLPGGGRIWPTTSSARSALGGRLTFVPQDETHSFTQPQDIKLADNQRRNTAGMGGRFLETTNAWSISEQSVAQLTYENPIGVFVDYPTPIGGSIRNKAERRKAMRHAYGDSVRNGATWKGWVDLDRIDVEIEALMKRDPAQAERFFLNRTHEGEAVAFDLEAWAQQARPDLAVADRSVITIGVDGALTEDALAIVATDVETFYQWPLHIQEVPPNVPIGYEHDLELADAAVRAAFDRFDVWRVYIDPQRIEKMVSLWQGRWGQDRIIEWRTNFKGARAVGNAVRTYIEEVARHEVTHDGSSDFSRHVSNARRRTLNVLDDDQQPLFTLSKERPHSPNKIDAAFAAVLSAEARRDAIASGVLNRSVGWFIGL